MKFIVTPFMLEDLKKYKEAKADGVLVGLKSFSVKSTVQLSIEELKTWCQMCENLDLECYVLLNRFFFEEDLEALEGIIKCLTQISVSGIYYNDEAILYIAKNYGLQSKLIYQGETLLTNHMDVDAYLEEGIQGVVLAKEITLDEMEAIAKTSDASKCIVQIHGHMAMMHSRRSLLTNYMQFLQREKEIQPSSVYYIQESTRDLKMPIYEDTFGTFIYSGDIQVSFSQIQFFMQSQIHAVIIDGMFQDSQYVLQMLVWYHQILENKIDGLEAERLYKETYQQHEISSGFLYRKTSKTK